MHITLQSRTYSSLASDLVIRRLDLELAERMTRRARELALASQNPSALGAERFAYALVKAGSDPREALEALDECIQLHARGANLASKGAALYISAGILAERGDGALAITRLRRSIEHLAPFGRSMELNGAFGYAIEILVRLGALADAAVLIGAVLAGALGNLQHMGLPPDRNAPDVRALRDTIGPERFTACLDQGSKLTYEELTIWLLETLDELAGSPDPPP